MQRTETHHLPVKLHQHEVLVKAQQAAKGLSTLKRIEDDKAEVTKDFAEQIKKKRRELDLLAHEVSTGTEVRPVECDLVPRRADIHTISPLVAAKLPADLTPGFRGRLVIQYDAVLDHLGRDERGVPVNLRNDLLTVRVQGEF